MLRQPPPSKANLLHMAPATLNSQALGKTRLAPIPLQHMRSCGGMGTMADHLSPQGSLIQAALFLVLWHSLP